MSPFQEKVGTACEKKKRFSMRALGAMHLDQYLLVPISLCLQQLGLSVLML